MTGETEMSTSKARKSLASVKASGAGKSSAAKARPAPGQAGSEPAIASSSASAAGLLTPYLSSNGDWSSVHPEVKKTIRGGDFASMEELFGSTPGVGQLIELSLSWFADDHGGVDIEWYVDADPITKRGVQRSIAPSRFNRALQETTCEEYKQRLLLEGQPQSVAGYLRRTEC